MLTNGGGRQTPQIAFRTTAGMINGGGQTRMTHGKVTGGRGMASMMYALFLFSFPSP